jgi:hypothetical protein
MMPTMVAVTRTSITVWGVQRKRCSRGPGRGLASPVAVQSSVVNEAWYSSPTWALRKAAVSAGITTSSFVGSSVGTAARPSRKLTWFDAGDAVDPRQHGKSRAEATLPRVPGS